MAPARTLGHQHEAGRLKSYILVGAAVEPCFRILHKYGFHHRRFRIGGVELHAVLRAVEGDDHQPLGRIAEMNPGNILDRRIPEWDLLDFTCVHIVAVEGYNRIRLACHRIFVAEATGVECVLVGRIAPTLIKGEGKYGNRRLVVAQVA